MSASVHLLTRPTQRKRSVLSAQSSSGSLPLPLPIAWTLIVLRRFGDPAAQLAAARVSPSHSPPHQPRISLSSLIFDLSFGPLCCTIPPPYSSINPAPASSSKPWKQRSPVLAPPLSFASGCWMFSGQQHTRLVIVRDPPSSPFPFTITNLDINAHPASLIVANLIASRPYASALVPLPDQRPDAFQILWRKLKPVDKPEEVHPIIPSKVLWLTIFCRAFLSMSQTQCSIPPLPFPFRRVTPCMKPTLPIQVQSPMPRGTETQRSQHPAAEDHPHATVSSPLKRISNASCKSARSDWAMHDS